MRKLSVMAIMALVGLLPFSCQKSNEEALETTQGGDTKKVAISVKKELISRSTLGYSVANGAETALEAGKLFFFSPEGNTVYTHEITSENIAAGTFIVENIPSTSVSVAMIANNAGTELASAAPATFEAFKLLRYGIDNQAKMADETGVAGTGKPNAIQGIALLDKLGAAGAANSLNAIAGEPTTHTHTAAITLVPAVSRIEIGANAIKVKANNTTNLESFKLNGIYINNYSPDYTLGLSQANTLFGSAISNGGTQNWAGSYTALTPSIYLYNELENPVLLSASDATTAGGYAFHVFPGETPDIIFRGTDFNYEEAKNVAGPQYWLVDKYWNGDGQEGDPGYEAGKGTPITAFQPGYVYKISSVLLGDTYPANDPYDEPVSVQVTLTVQKWQVNNVYVEPN